MKLVLICQKESSPLSLAKGTYNSVDMYLWLHIKVLAGLQAPSVSAHKYLLHVSELMLASSGFLHPRQSLLSLSPSLSRSSLFYSSILSVSLSHLLWLFSLLPQIALAMSSLLLKILFGLHIFSLTTTKTFLLNILWSSHCIEVNKPIPQKRIVQVFYS